MNEGEWNSSSREWPVVNCTIKAPKPGKLWVFVLGKTGGEGRKLQINIVNGAETTIRRSNTFGFSFFLLSRLSHSKKK
jgi:hypothetical protein